VKGLVEYDVLGRIDTEPPMLMPDREPTTVLGRALMGGNPPIRDVCVSCLVPLRRKGFNVTDRMNMSMSV